jgi:hypothetical protein
VAFGRLHRRPREFAYADDVDVCLIHQSKVGVPVRLGPLLRIPGRTETER